MLHGLASHILRVQDLAAARDWYARILEQQPGFDQPFYVGFDVEGFELGLLPSPEAPGSDAPAATAYWRVADVPAALARLVDAGATPMDAPQDVGGGIVLAAVRDPFGNRLGVIDNPHFRVPPVTSTVVAERTLAAPDGALAPVDQAHSVTIPLPRAEAWRRWTDAEAVRGWLHVDCRVEARIGGPWELFFMPDAPEGSRGGEGVRVLSMLADRMLSFTWNAPPGQPLTRPHHTWVVIWFEDCDAGSRVTLHHTGWPAAGWTDTGEPRPGSPWPETHAYFAQAWPRLMAAFAAGAPG